MSIIPPSFPRRGILLGMAAAVMPLSALADQCKPKIEASELVAAGKLQMSMNPTLPPQQYVDEKGELQGLNVELQREIARRLCLEPVIIRMNFGGMIPALAAGRFDGINTGMFWTEERSRTMNTVPYAQQTISFAVIPDSTANVTTPEQLAGHSVSLESNSYQERWLRGIDKENVAKGLKPMDIKAFPTATEVLAVMRARQVEIGILIDQTANEMVRRGLVKVLTTGLAPAPTTFAFRSRKLAQLFADTLNEMRADGTYGKLFEKFGITQFPADKPFVVAGPGPKA
jgi:polar amino acid transport system substrate-binding protein